jgi:hypothetical protein
MNRKGAAAETHYWRPRTKPCAALEIATHSPQVRTRVPPRAQGSAPTWPVIPQARYPPSNINLAVLSIRVRGRVNVDFDFESRGPGTRPECEQVVSLCPVGTSKLVHMGAPLAPAPPCWRIRAR